MSAAVASTTGVLDLRLEQLRRRRERAMSGPPSAARSARIAEIYEREARVWSLLFERSSSRLRWRAALSAEAHARACAWAWRQETTAQRCGGDQPSPSSPLQPAGGAR